MTLDGCLPERTTKKGTCLVFLIGGPSKRLSADVLEQLLSAVLAFLASPLVLLLLKPAHLRTSLLPTPPTPILRR